MAEALKITRQRELEAEVAHLVPRLALNGATLVVLHGAVASGNVGPASKIRLLVVADADLPFRERPAHFLKRLKTREPVELLVFTPREFARAREESALVRAALKKGRVVYAAGRG